MYENYLWLLRRIVAGSVVHSLVTSHDSAHRQRSNLYMRARAGQSDVTITFFAATRAVSPVLPWLVRRAFEDIEMSDNM
eukprot:6210792-Pleurochrysis_carterae.AAC.4